MMFWVLSLQGMPPVWVLQLVGLVLVQITRVLWLRWAIVLMRHVFFGQKKQETFRDGNLGVLFGDFLGGFLGSSWGCSSTRVIKQTKFNSGMLKDYWPSCAQEAKTKYVRHLKTPPYHFVFWTFPWCSKRQHIFGNPICTPQLGRQRITSFAFVPLGNSVGWFWHWRFRTCKKHVGEVCIVQWFYSIDSIVYHT